MSEEAKVYDFCAFVKARAIERAKSRVVSAEVLWTLSPDLKSTLNYDQAKMALLMLEDPNCDPYWAARMARSL